MLPVLESMNVSGESMVQLPTDRWPTRITRDDSGHGSFVVSERWNVDDVVGSPVLPGVFDRPGWTLENLARFVASHQDNRVALDGLCPTVATLAAFLGVPFLVVAASGGRCTLSFVTADGDVTAADDVDGTVVEALRDAFFTDGLKAALAVGGLDVRGRAVVNPDPVCGLALLRQVQLREWQQEHHRGHRSAPAGARLTATDLQLVPRDDFDTDKPVIASVQGPEHLYELIFPTDHELAPLEVLCAVDGTLQAFVDMGTGKDRGLGAQPAEWAEWILADTVTGKHSAAGKLWEDDSPGAQLYRMANQIVTYEDHEAATSQFVTARELNAWLQKVLGNHNAPFTVHLLDDVGLMLTDDDKPMIQRHTHDRGAELKQEYQPKRFYPWSGTANWLSNQHRGFIANPSMFTNVDGVTVESAIARNCLDFADVEAHLLPDDTMVDLNSWFIVRLGDTPTCITFPALDIMLQVSLDNDGATAFITAREAFTRKQELQAEYAFEQQWARWLDDDYQLTKAEIRDGLATLGELVEGCSE